MSKFVSPNYDYIFIFTIFVWTQSIHFMDDIFVILLQNTVHFAMPVSQTYRMLGNR